MFTYPREPIATDELFSLGWQFYKDTIRYVWFWSLLMALAYVVYSQLGFTELHKIGKAEFTLIDAFGHLVLIAIWAFFYNIIILRMHSLTGIFFDKDKTTIAYSGKKFLPVYFAHIIYTILIIIGSFALILPGIYVWIILSMNSLFILFEEDNIIKALVNSARIVQKAWWQTFLVILLPSLLIYILRNTPHLFSSDKIIFSIFDIFILTFVTPYLYALTLLQFNNLKIIADLPKPVSSEKRIQND